VTGPGHCFARRKQACDEPHPALSRFVRTDSGRPPGRQGYLPKGAVRIGSARIDPLRPASAVRVPTRGAGLDGDSGAGVTRTGMGSVLVRDLVCERLEPRQVDEVAQRDIDVVEVQPKRGSQGFREL
jgi:hypothetical protein